MQPKQVITEMRLYLSEMRASSLVDTGTFMDPQDPALYIRVGHNQTFSTERQKDAKTEATFTGEAFDVEIDPDEFEGGLDIEVEVKNESGTKLIHVGRGKGLLQNLMGTEHNTKVALQIPLTHYNKKGIAVSGGMVEMTGYIECYYGEELRPATSSKQGSVLGIISDPEEKLKVKVRRQSRHNPMHMPSAVIV